MRTDLIELKKFLEAEMEKRQKNNRRYSKRAFARDIGLSTTALCEFLSGKRDLNFKNIDLVFKYLNKKVHCSWCDKPHKQTKYIIGGPRQQYICDKCVKICVDIAKEHRTVTPSN